MRTPHWSSSTSIAGLLDPAVGFEGPAGMWPSKERGAVFGRLPDRSSFEVALLLRPANSEEDVYRRVSVILYFVPLICDIRAWVGIRKGENHTPNILKTVGG